MAIYNLSLPMYIDAHEIDEEVFKIIQEMWQNIIVSVTIPAAATQWDLL